MIVSYESRVKKLGGRDWLEICKTWPSSVALLNLPSPGQAPLSDFAAIPGATDLIRQATATTSTHRSEELPGLRPLIIHEAIFLSHKAANVLVSAHDSAYSGSPTWSLATAYQGAYFAASAILRFMGVAVFQQNKKSYIVDVFPPPGQLSKKQLKLWQIGSEIEIIPFQESIGHFQFWGLFKRCLRMTSKLPFDAELLAAIDRVGDQFFSEQRNVLHYTSSWQFEDLSLYAAIPPCMNPTDKADLLRLLENDSGGFGFALGTVLLLFLTTLIRQAAQLAPPLLAESSLLSQACAEDRLKLSLPYIQASAMSF